MFCSQIWYSHITFYKSSKLETQPESTPLSLAFTMLPLSSLISLLYFMWWFSNMSTNFSKFHLPKNATSFQVWAKLLDLLLTDRLWLEVPVCGSWTFIIKDITASSFLFLGTLMMGEASCHVVRTLRQPCEKAHMWGMEASCQQPWKCTTLEVNPPALIKLSDDCSLHQHVSQNH